MSSSSLRASAQQTSLRVQGLGLGIYRVMQGRLLHIPFTYTFGSNLTACKDPEAKEWILGHGKA